MKDSIMTLYSRAYTKTSFEFIEHIIVQIHIELKGILFESKHYD